MQKEEFNLVIYPVYSVYLLTSYSTKLTSTKFSEHLSI